MKKLYNKPETLLQEMEVETIIAQSAIRIEDTSAIPEVMEAPERDYNTFDYEW